MKKNGRFNLIQGEFSPAEARELVMNLFQNKLNFHDMKNFSSMERFGEEDKVSVKRIQELQRSLLSVTELLSNAKEQNKSLRIVATVEIQMSESVE
jgi:hypothetical protein